MDTLADMRRALVVGAKVETLAGLGGVTPNPRIAGVRTVTKADTTGIYLNATPADGKRGSFMSWELASAWTITGDTFTNTDGRAYRLIVA
jgi:hypothetical protein